MHRILDIHTHRSAPQFEAVVCAAPEDFAPVDGQYYSVGIHPWSTIGEVPESAWESLRAACESPLVVAVGECGIDLVKGGPLFRQMQVMKRQAELAEELGKPLVIHCVHAHDIVIGMKKDLRPEQSWMVHGFRGKPTVARMLVDAGIWLSFGSRFNPASVERIPLEMMLAETDDSSMAIADVIRSLSSLRGEDLTETIAENSDRFLSAGPSATLKQG